MGTGDDVGRTYPKPAGGTPNFPRWRPRYSTTGTPTTPSGPASPGVTARPEYVFYDGPPFANGLPHYGHLLTGYVKDIVPRYRTMRGYQVERRFGWDTHGLPAELEVQRQLGITDKAQIEEMGIEKFNDACRDSVLKYTERVACLRHPPGPLGRLRQRLQDAGSDVHGVGDLGVQAAVGQGPWRMRACACCRTAGTTRPRCPATNCGWTTTSTRAARTRRSPWASGSTGAGGRWPARTSWSGRRRRGRCRPTRPWPSTPMSTYVEVAGPDGDRYVLAQARLAAYARELGEEPQILATHAGADLLGMPLPAAVPVLHGLAQRFSGAAAATSSPPRTAPASCTCRRPTVRTTRRPPTPSASSRSRRSTPRAASTRRFRTTRVSTSSTPTRRSSAT